MISVDMRDDAREIRRVLAGYQRGADRVLLRTLNRVMPSVKTRAARELAADLGIPVSAATQALVIRRAVAGNLVADLKADTKRIPLIKFQARQTRAGVTYKIGKTPRRLLPRAFINVGPKVGRTVLKRARATDQFNVKVKETGRRRYVKFIRGTGEELVGRYPTLIKYGPSPAAIFVKEAVQKALDVVARDRWRNELNAQIKFFLSQMRV